jgi:mannose-1-phosphate guanylyltransferase / mannose-6-phosphate isomerase
MHKFDLLTIPHTGNIKQALKTIDKNKNRFVIVLDSKKVTNVITDGDIRRLILEGKSLEDNLTINNDFTFVDYKDKFDVICELFMNEEIEFLPILKNGELFNIITRYQFNAMMLEGIDYKSNIDFFALNNVTTEHQVCNKPWGWYKSVWLSSHAQVKIITVYPSSELSLQKHFHREEHWIVVKGSGNVICEDKNYTVSSGDYIHIPKEFKHRLTNISLKNNLILSEVQLGDYFGEDDIIRFSDKYGRS